MIGQYGKEFRGVDWKKELRFYPIELKNDDVGDSYFLSPDGSILLNRHFHERRGKIESEHARLTKKISATGISNYVNMHDVVMNVAKKIGKYVNGVDLYTERDDSLLGLPIYRRSKTYIKGHMGDNKVYYQVLKDLPNKKMREVMDIMENYTMILDSLFVIDLMITDPSSDKPANLRERVIPALGTLDSFLPERNFRQKKR